ncbi:hypothetical protein N7451_007381 [Penicillium sp. IBT 35674x]|nr:hypothetical protein N7451_007381 [Penicillium sp. IBT 35674x]
MDRGPTIGGTEMKSAKTGEHCQGSLDPDQPVSYNADSTGSPVVFAGLFACQAALGQSHMADTLGPSLHVDVACIWTWLHVEYPQ